MITLQGKGMGQDFAMVMGKGKVFLEEEPFKRRHATSCMMKRRKALIAIKHHYKIFYND